MHELKDTNPKDAVGVRKAGMSCVPAEVLLELGLAMQEGARKYGRHNYRIAGVRASVYYDAAMRHLMAWWEGEDIDPDSGCPHLVKAMACILVIRDAVVNNNWTDDRPPSLPSGWQSSLNKKASDLIDHWPNAKEPYTKQSFPIVTTINWGNGHKEVVKSYCHLSDEYLDWCQKEQAQAPDRDS